MDQTIKLKDPKKVERGKKLGAISQMAKSKKRLAEELQKRELENAGEYTVFYVIGGGVVLLGLGYLYYTKRKPVVVVEDEKPAVTVVKNNCSRMVNFD